VATRGWIYTSANSQQTPIAGYPGGQDEGIKNRLREALRNAKRIARHYGADYDDFAKVWIETYNVTVVRPLFNAVQAEPEFWGTQSSYTKPVYPNRSIQGNKTFNGLDCLRPDGSIYSGTASPVNGQVVCDSPADVGIGDIAELNIWVGVRLLSGPRPPLRF
jgi:hypothetical protein